MTDHPQVPLVSRPGVFVDDGLRPLLEFLNRGGWPTVYSCQGSPRLAAGQPGCPYVMFAAAESLAGATDALANLALAAGDYELAARALGDVTAPVGPPGRRWVQTHGRQWRYEVHWTFHAEGSPAASRVLTATLRLSSDDLTAITRLLEPGVAPPAA